VPPERVTAALAQAGDNRPELERVLEHYRHDADERKLAAAEFLIANMPGHGFAEMGFFDADDNRVPFDAMEHASLSEAQQVLDRLEAEHGELHLEKASFVSDLETMPADLLIDNIELAFEAWASLPWASDLTFETFCEFVLPYRGSNEPLNAFRAEGMSWYRTIADEADDPRSVGAHIQKDVHRRVRFNDQFYLHPTDQGFSEMLASGQGRCEDISNMMSYAMRSNAVPVATDYTPYWADRDNNHAWEVLLDHEGNGRAGLSNRAAKIYRKMFSRQPETLGVIKRPDEQVPRYLQSASQRDVTDQYMPTSDVTVELTEPAPDGHRFVYICVFNAGDWRAVHFAPIRDGRATFTDMGRNIAYIPAYHVDRKMVAAASPFILDAVGTVRTLDGSPGSLEIELASTKPSTPDADTRRDIPSIPVKQGRRYELMYWDRAWRTLGAREAGADPVVFDRVPADRLLWLVEEGSRKLERIFTVEDGQQVWW
jgi:hypothetical protein